MSDVSLAIMTALGGVVVGALGYWLWLRVTVGGVRAEATRIMREAELTQQRLVHDAEVDAKEAQMRMQQEVERDTRKKRDELAATEKRLRQRETDAERKNKLVEKRERELKKRQGDIDAAEDRARQMEREARDELHNAQHERERVAGLSQEEARKQLMAAVEEEARQAAAAQIERLTAEAEREGKERAQRIIAGSIQRLASEFVAEKTVSVVELPSDDMKGRIIGREGRNIRAIEAATGVDVIIDDTPEMVVLSAFNPLRREVARLALQRLIADGRIHPARIEEVVDKVRGELDEVVLRAGEQATFDLGLHGLHPELVKLLGRLKYVVVGGQNIWNHSVETGTIAGLMAAEMGANVMLAKRAGLLHDIGKAVDHEVEGAHAQVAAEQARRFGEKPEVQQAIAEHHDDQPSTLLGVLVQAADQLSKARPGARREVVESSVKRLEDIERIGQSFKGVERAWAMQSGREVRVVVSYGEVTDQEALLLSNDIARRIEDELTYPGEVKIIVIREARATEIAR